MDLEVRKWVTTVEEIDTEGGPRAVPPLRKVAVVALIENPYAGRWSETLNDLVTTSGKLGAELVARARDALGADAESCGKGAIIGVNGEQEHGVACLTTPFGDAMRAGVGGTTWVTSTTKVAGPGSPIDIPLAYKRALFVREFYDTVTVAVPDGPRASEIAVVVALANRGRVHHRVGGLTKEEATVGDGLQ